MSEEDKTKLLWNDKEDGIQPDLSKEEYNCIERLELINNNLLHMDVAKLPKNVKILILDDNSLTSLKNYEIPEAVTKLGLTNNKFSGNIDMSTFDTLKSIWIEDNEISSFTAPKSCTILYIDGNQLTQLPNANYDSITTLSVGNNKIEGIELTSKSLRKLDISDNTLKFLKLNLPKLKTLEANSTNLFASQYNNCHFPKLEIFNATHNTFVIFDADPSAFPNLKELDLSSNYLSETSLLFKYLQVLNLSDNEFVNFDLSSETLQNLNLSKNKLKLFADNNNNLLPPEALPNLEELDLTNNSISENIPSFPKLSILNLSNNLIISFYMKSATIKKLDLSQNRIISFCDIDDKTELKAEDLPELEELNLSDNSILEETNIPSFPKLKILNLSKNKFNDYFWWISHTLVKLNLSNCEIKTFYMNHIEHGQKYILYSAIEELDLSNNRLTNITFESKTLKIANFSHNLIDSYDINCPNFEELDLSHNKLKYMKFGLQKLKKLNASYNFVKSCNMDIPSIVEIDLSNNQLDEIENANTFTYDYYAKKKLAFPNVVKINFSNNKLVTIPLIMDAAKDLTTSLKIFNLANNTIRVIQAKMIPKSVVELDVSNNPCQNIDPELLDGHLKLILDTKAPEKKVEKRKYLCGMMNFHVFMILNLIGGKKIVILLHIMQELVMVHIIMVHIIRLIIQEPHLYIHFQQEKQLLFNFFIIYYLLFF